MADSGDRIEHLVVLADPYDESAPPGYRAACGLVVLPASLTEAPLGRCRPCAQHPENGEGPGHRFPSVRRLARRIHRRAVP